MTLAEIVENNNHAIFDEFQKVQCVGTGHHIFDFLGVATNVQFRDGWAKHALNRGSKYKSGLPILNEHYFDWISLLTSVNKGSGIFRMAELGAGWAPWLVRGAFAAKQNKNVSQLELIGVEADPTHYQWMLDHFSDNNLSVDDYQLLHGAVSAKDTMLEFPVVHNPGTNYGASICSDADNAGDSITIKGYTLDDLLSRFTGPVDFIHMDIQGAEYDVLPEAMDLLSRTTKCIMIGTHRSAEKDASVKALFEAHNWDNLLYFPWKETVQTEFGEVKFDDGFHCWVNPDLY